MSLPLLYLIFCVLPSAAGWVGTFTIFAIIGFIILVIAYCLLATTITDDDEKRKMAKLLACIKRTACVMAVFALLDIFLPDTAQIYTITGAYAVTNNAEMAKLPDNVLKAANSYLENLNSKKP